MTRLRDYVGRGVVTTATYAARAFGVHSAMGLMKAARLCPQAILLPVDFDEYRRYSRLFKAVIAELAPVVEDRGVDEVYIDFGAAAGRSRAGRRALALTRSSGAIYERTGLTCSIGVAPNKLIAKMASEFRQAERHFDRLRVRSGLERIWPLPCRRSMASVRRPSDTARAARHRTIGELARCERGWLVQHFGRNHGSWMYEAAWGRDERAGGHRERAGVDEPRDHVRARSACSARPGGTARTCSPRCASSVADDLQRHGYVGKTIGVKLRYDNFQRATRDQTIDGYTNDAALIRRTAGLCLKRAPLERRLRLLGVKVAGLVRSDSAARETASPAPPAELSLF